MSDIDPALIEDKKAENVERLLIDLVTFLVCHKELASVSMHDVVNNLTDPPKINIYEALSNILEIQYKANAEDMG